VLGPWTNPGWLNVGGPRCGRRVHNPFTPHNKPDTTIRMHVLSWHDFVLRLGVAILAGVLIGLERQWRSRGAGLRRTRSSPPAPPCSSSSTR